MRVPSQVKVTNIITSAKPVSLCKVIDSQDLGTRLRTSLWGRGGAPVLPTELKERQGNAVFTWMKDKTVENGKYSH